MPTEIYKTTLRYINNDLFSQYLYVWPAGNNSITIYNTDGERIKYSYNGKDWNELPKQDSITVSQLVFIDHDVWHVGDNCTVTGYYNVGGKYPNDIQYKFTDQTYLVSAKDLILPKITTDNKSDYKNLFKGCTSLVEVPNLVVDTRLNIGSSYGRVEIIGTFEGCTSLVNPPSITFDYATSVVDLSNLFKGCTSLTSAPSLTFSNATGYEYEGIILDHMFQDCISLTSGAIISNNVQRIQSAVSMYAGCTSLVNPNFPTGVKYAYKSTLNDNTFNNMYGGCTSLVHAPAVNLISVGRQCFKYMFYGCTNLETPLTFTAPNYEDSIFVRTPADSSGNNGLFEGTYQDCSKLAIPMNVTIKRSGSTAISRAAFYINTYKNCSSLYISSSQNSTYTNPIVLVSIDNPADTSYAYSADMLVGTSGTFTGTPTINTTYYYK